jgi:hypothetical protein
MLRDPRDDFGGGVLPPGDDDFGGKVIPSVVETPTWSSGGQLTLTGSTDVTTSVAIMIENAADLALDRAGKWQMIARTSIAGGRIGSADVSPFESLQLIPILFGTQEVPTYGQDVTFTMTVDLISPSGQKFSYQVEDGKDLVVSNRIDNTGPVHGSATPASSLVYSFGVTEQGVQTKSVYFDVTDPESGIVSLATPILSTSSYGATITYITNVTITNGRRFIYNLNINGSQVDVGTSASVGVRLSARNGAGMTSSSSYVYATINKADDSTGPVISMGETPAIVLTASAGTLNNSTYRAIDFNASDASGISSVTVNGNNSTSENIKYYGVSNLGNGNYRQTIYVTADKCAIGSTASFSYTITVTDNNGNSTSKQHSVNMSRYDNVAPTFSVVTDPTDLTFYTSSGTGQSAYRTVVYRVVDGHTSVDKNSVEVIRSSGSGSSPTHYQGWSGDEFHFRWYVNSNDYGIGAAATRESFYIKVRDIHGNLGTSSVLSFFAKVLDDQSPSISVKHVDSKTFYTSNNTGNPSGQTSTGYIYWSASDNVSVASASGSRIGSTSYIQSVGSTSSTSSYGAQYRTSYVLISNFSYSSSYTARSLVRLSASDAAGNNKTSDVSISGRLIDNTKPYFSNIPASQDKTWYTSGGASQGFTFSKTVDVSDQHQSIASHSVTKLAGTFTNVTSSLSGGKISFSFTPGSNSQTANGNWVSQTVRISITDSAGNSQTIDWTGRTRFIDNTTPIISPTSGSTNEENCNFFKSSPQNVSRTVYFTVSDSFSAIDTGSFTISTPSIYYMSVSGISNHSGNTYKYTCTIPVSGKAIHPTRIFWGHVDVTADDIYGNRGSMRTSFYGSHFDDVSPSIGNVSAPAYNFTTSGGQTSITNTLTFRATDAHSGINTPTVSGSNGATAGTITAGSNGYYTCPVTVIRPGLTNAIMAKVAINVSDVHGNQAGTFNYTLPGSYVDNKGPQIGAPSGNSTVNFAVSSGTSTIDRSISVGVTDEIALSSITVTPINGAKGEVLNLSSISGTSSTATFKIRHVRSEYSANSSQTETYRINCSDTAGNNGSRDVSISVNYNDDTSPIISNAATTISANFTESNPQSVKVLTYTFNVSDTGSGVKSVNALSDITITQPVKGSGTSYSMTATVDRGSFTHNGSYHNVGGIDISVRDHANNISTHGVTVRAKLTDNVSPVLDSVSPSNVNMTTTGSNVTQSFAIGVSDSGAINSSSVQAQRTAGNGAISASFSSGKLNVVITNIPSNYTANNVYVSESYRVRIADDNGNYSSWRTIAFSARTRDTTPPTITSVSAPSFIFSESGASQLTKSGVIRLTDAHMGINVGSFNASMNPSNRGVDVDRMILTAGPGANEYTYNLTVNKNGQSASGSAVSLALTMSIQDNASNSASTTAFIPVTVNDDIAPTITFTNVPSVSALSSQGRIKTYTVSYTVSDSTDGNPPANKVSLAQKGAAIANVSIGATQKIGSAYYNAVTVNASSLGHNSVANIYFTASARDSAGNVGSKDSGVSAVTVVDDVKPTISVSSSASNITLNNTNNQSQSVSATFLVSDDLTSAGSLNVNAHGASKSHSNGTVTLTKTFTYASGTSGGQELRCTVTDAAGNSSVATSSFTVNRHSYDLTAPTITAPTSLTNGGSNKVILDANTSSFTFTIAATITDSGSGVNPSTVKISSNSSSISGQVLHNTFNPSTGAATFRVTWALNDSRWSTLWSNGTSTVFSEIFTIHASDLEGAPYTNSASRTIQINLARRDVVAPSLSISSVKTRGSNITGSNPLLFSDIDRTSDELVINMVASDAQTNLNSNSWKLTLAPVPATGNTITYATANGSYNFGDDASTGLDVANTSGNNYQIAMRLQSPNNNSILGNISSGGIPFGNSTLRATLTVGDNNSNSTTTSSDFIIKRVDSSSPNVGNLIARSGSLTNISVSHSSTTYTHKVKVAASDSGSGLQSVTMNNSYVADSPSSANESGTLYYYFKRVYTFAEVWQDKHASTITVSGLRATARDIQGNASNSNSVNVVVTANDTENPLIAYKSITASTLNMNTSTSTTAQQTFTVIIEDDDTRSSAVAVTISEVEGSGSLTLTNITGSAERRVFTGNYTYMQSSFSPGSYNRNWNISVVDAAGNSSSDSFPEFGVNVVDTTNPSISSVTIFNSSGQSVTSANLDTSTNTGFSGYIDVIMSDVHSSVNVSSLAVTSGAPVVIGGVQVLGSTKGRVSIAIGASSMASALGYGSKNIVFNVSVKDVYNNGTSTAKSMGLIINDSTPPTISNVSVSNISMNYDIDGVNDPDDQAFVLKANVTDAGSGLNSVSASVTFNTGIVNGTNAALSFIRRVGSLYEWRYIVSHDDLSINASATPYTFKITANPNYGSNTTKTVTATAQLRDDTGPRLSMPPVERLSGQALSVNERVDILTSVGSVVLVYEVTAVEKSDPITLSNITSDAGDLDYVIQSTTAKSVKATVTYTAAQVLALTSGNYNSDTSHKVTMVVSDKFGNQSTVQSAAYRLRVYDNQNPTVSNFVASDTTVVLKTSSKSQTIDFTAQIADNVSIASYSLPGTTFINKSGNTYRWRKTFDYVNYSYGLANETYTLTVVDSNGNTVSVNEGISVTKIDDEIPAITSFSANDTTVTLLTTSQTQVVTFNAVMSDNVAITSFNIPGLVFIGKSGNDYTWGKTYRYSDYSYGSVSEVFTLTIRDAAGNIRTATETINVSKTDNENPVISSFSADSSNVTLLTSAKTKVVTFTADISDNVAISSATLNGGVNPVITTGNRRTWVKTFNYVSYAYGSTTDTFTLTVTDSNGNKTTNAINVVVTKSDDQHPSISNFSINDDTIVLKTSNKATARTITATISDNVSIVDVKLPNATFVGASNNLYTWNVFYAYADYNYGNQTETYTVTATDSSGNSTTKSISVSISKSDDQAPSISNFIASPDTVTLLTSAKSKTINITATISDNVAVDNVDLPGAQLVSNSNGSYLWRKTYDYANYSFGSVTDSLVLSVTDNSGNSSSATESVLVTKSDDEKPVITSFSGSANAVSLTTSVPSRTVTFTAVISDNVSLANVTLPGATSVGVSGSTYTWRKTYSYADYGFGANVATDSLTLTATDTSGNASTASVAVAITKRDDEKPVINSFTIDRNAISLKTSAQEVVAEFSANISDNVAIANATINGGTVPVDTSGSIRRWTKAFKYGDFSFGSTTQTFVLTVTDTSDNIRTASLNVVVTKSDDENPVISSFTISDESISLSTNNQSQTVTFTAVASDNVSISKLVLLGASVQGVIGNTYTWEKTFLYSDYAFGTTPETYTVVATDTSENTTSKSLSITVSKGDTEDPVISSFIADNAKIYVKTSDKSKTVTLTAIISDNVAVTNTSLPGATSAGVSGSTYTWTKDYYYENNNYGENQDMLTLTVTDAAGNTATANKLIRIIKIDDESPAITSFTANPSVVNIKTSAQNQTVTLTAIISDNVAVTNTSLPGATYVGKLGNTYTWRKEYEYADYSYGTASDNMTLEVSDAEGNNSTDSLSVTVIKSDDKKPTITSLTASSQNVSVITSAQSQSVTFTAVISDNVSIGSAVLDGDVVEGTTTGGTRTWTKTYEYGSYSFGSTSETYNLTVIDTSGNQETASISVIIVKSDDENPTISSFSADNLTPEVYTSSQSQTVTFTAIITDNVNIASVSLPSATYVGVIGNTHTWRKELKYVDLSYGTTEIVNTLTVKDSSGNTTSKSVTINVTKSDDENPSVTNFAADNDSIIVKTSDKSKTVTFTANISDNVGIQSINLPGATLANQSGAVYTWTKVYNYSDYQYGANTDTLTLKVIDTAANEINISEVVTITKIDDETPVISNFSASDSGVVIKTSVKSKTVTFTANIADNVSIQTTSLPGASYIGKVGNEYTWSKTYNYADYQYGSVNDTLTLTVTDWTGNVSIEQVVVAVTKVDDQDPSILAFTVDDSSVTLLTSSKTQLVTFEARVSDNVNISKVTLNGGVTEVVKTGLNRSWTKLYDYERFNYGSVSETFTLTVEDTSGNTKVETLNVVITKSDDESPVISSFTVDDATVSLLTSSKVQTVAYTAVISDNVSVTGVSTPGGGAATVIGNTYTWTKQFLYGDYSYGNTPETHTVVAEDAAGNTASASVNIIVSKIDNQEPTSTSITVDKTDFDLTQNESTTLTITAGFRDLQTGMSNVAGSAKVLLENGSELDSSRIDSVTITTSNGGSDSSVVAVINVSFDDLDYGNNRLAFKISAGDNSNNSIISDLVTINGNKYDSIPPEIISYKLRIDGVETNSVDFNETTRTTAVLTLEAKVKDNKAGTVVKVNNVTTANITPIDGVANGTTHVWSYNLVNTTYPIEDVTNLNYTVTVNDADGLTAVSQTLPLKVTRIDNIPPKITINSVEAIELQLGTGNQLTDIISGNNEFTLKSNPALATHSAKLVIKMSVEENNTLAPGYPSIHPVNGWIKGSASGNNYVFTKIVTGAELDLGINNLAFRITATDSAASSNSDFEDVTFIGNVIDNTNPVISSFTMSGVPEVSGVPTILLKESDSQNTVTASFNLATSDNGTMSKINVQIRDSVNNISFDLSPLTSGSGNFTFAKTFAYSDFNLANSVISNLVINARVEDAAGNITMSNPIEAQLRQVDDVSPVMTYNLTGAYTSTANDVVLEDGHLWTYKSSLQKAQSGTAYLKAVVTGSDPRGITSINVTATSSQANAPVITMTEGNNGIFTGSLSYNALPEYGVAYTYQITATVTDAQSQQSVETKNISFNKLDDISPTASLALVEGLVGGVKSMSTASNNDNVIYLELDVNENTILALSNNPTLSLLGSGAQTTLVNFAPSGSGASGRYRYQISLDKSDYQFTNLKAGFDQGSRIANESVKLSLADHAGNTLEGEPVELLTFSVELTDDGNPFSKSISYSANNGIQSAGVNSKQFNLSVNNVSDGTKITIAAALGDNETNLDPDAFGISGFNATKSFNVATKTAFFEITVNRAFYDTLALYDEYESKAFTITFKDLAGNINTIEDSLEFKRTDSDDPIINSWTANGSVDATIIHYDHHTHANQQTINVSLSANVSDERLSNMYYTTTKNGVLLPGNTGTGSWVNQTFASVRPPRGSDAWGTIDNYIFKLYAVDANGATVSAEATLAVKFLDVTAPSINNLLFMDLSRSNISELQILTENEPDAQAIVRETIVRASANDFVDTLDQMTVELVAADNLSGNVITKIERLDNVNTSVVEFKVTMTTGTYLTGVIQPITVRLNVTDRTGNLRSDTRSLNVKISDNQAPVIYSLTSDIVGDKTSYPNHVRATSNINNKVVTNVITAYVYDETEVDLSTASFTDANGKAYNVVSAVSTGTYNASPSWKIIAQREINYDEQELALGTNTITVTATVSDVNSNVSQAVSVDQTVYKEDALAPTLLAMGLYDNNATTVKDNAWPAALIDVVSDTNIDANGAANAKGKSVFVIMNAHVTNDITDQVLFEAGGESDESSLIMCIKNNRFVVAAGSNSGSALHNTSAILSFDMRNDASSNPLASHMGSGSAIELALLVRLDVGAIILYVNGKLAGAAQADERNMPAWAGSVPEIAMGHLVSSNKRNAFGPNVSGGVDDYNWSGDILGMEVYEWSSVNSTKVAAEAASINVSLDVNNKNYRGELIFTCLDNEPDVVAKLSKNAVSTSESIINGIVRNDIVYDYATVSGTTTTTDNFIANAVQWQTIGLNKTQPLQASRAMSIVYQNLDIEAPVVNGFTILNESNGDAQINDGDIVQLSSTSNIALKFTINASDNSGIVSATDTFALSVGGQDFTQLSSQVAGDAFSFRYTADWKDFFATGDPTSSGDYYMNVVASVRDAAGNISVSKNRTLHFRTTDNTAPIISSAAFIAPVGMATTGSVNNNDYMGIITLSSANPSVQVRMKVDYTDNNTRYSGGFSVSGTGSVYTNGPSPRSTWSLDNTTDNGIGGYSATLVSTYEYSQLSIKNANQYRFGNDGNIEQLTAVLSDPHGNQTSFQFNVKVFMVDDAAPSLPQLVVSPSSIVLQPGDVNKMITLTVTTHDNSNIIADDVSIVVTSSGQDDISGLISTFSDITGGNPYPSNKKVFSAQLELDYNDITGPYSVDKTYGFAIIVKDSFQNTTTNNSAGQLVIQRVDNQPPILQQVKRNALSQLYNTSIPASKYTAIYNEVAVSASGDGGSDLRFAIEDVGGLSTDLFIKRSVYAVADATNPILSDPDFSSSDKIDLVLKSDGKYEPSSRLVFEYDDFAEYSINNTNKVYYQWWLISASDIAGNKTEVYMPWRISKNDVVAPSVPIVSLSQSSVKNGNVLEETPFALHSTAEKLVINITSALDKKVLSFKVTATDNHNIAKVCLLGHPNDPVSNELAGPNADGFYSINREYAFSHLDGYGERLIETIYIVAIDESDNRRSHSIPVYINQIDVTAPVINLGITSLTGEDEIKYPGTGITLVATGTVTDSNTGVLTSSVKQVGIANGWSFNGIQQNGTFQWSKVINWNANEIAQHTESFKIEAEDNSGNRSESTATFNYSITNNNDIAEVGTSVKLDDGETLKLVTSNPFSVDPARNYEAEYVFVVNDPNNLQTPVAGDITLTGNATLVSQSKTGSSGNQTFTVRVAFNTSNFVKGDNNNVKVSMIVRDPYDQTAVFDLEQTWYVWNYETIDLGVDYYYIYEANMNPLINKVRDQTGAITGYSMNAISGTFNGLQRIAMNLPTGSKEVSLEPFIVEQREEDSPDVVKSSWTFDIDSIVTANNQGVVEATIEIEDKSIDISYIDDYSMAQVIYSNYDQVGIDADGNPIGQSYVPTVQANTADKLNRQINKNYLMSHPAISGSINARALNFLRSDAPGVSSVTLAPISTGDKLDQLAHRNNLFGQESIIETGQYFVLNGTVKYSVVVNDANSVAHTVVSEQPVKLVIKHKPGIATIN